MDLEWRLSFIATDLAMTTAAAFGRRSIQESEPPSWVSLCSKVRPVHGLAQPGRRPLQTGGEARSGQPAADLEWPIADRLLKLETGIPAEVRLRRRVRTFAIVRYRFMYTVIFS
jgi:hypothetical protein